MGINKKIQAFREERERLNEKLLAPDNGASIMKRVFAADHYTYLERGQGLDAKHKEMLGLVSSMVLRCDDCIKYHLEQCFLLGVANDEMMDIFGVANVVGGTIVIPHTRRAMEYWELLRDKRPDPSPFSADSKRHLYEEAIIQLNSLLAGVGNPISRMATLIEVLKSKMAYFYWVGFYLAEEKRLTVGPYQGTHGCLFIDYGKGLCGRAAQSGQTIIANDIKQLNREQQGQKGDLHITCDPRCRAEIVVPVKDHNEKLIAVFDVDSLHLNAFDKVDQAYLESILKQWFGAGSPQA